MRYFTLVKYNVSTTDEEIVEKALVTVFGETALEVLDTANEYLNGKGSRFYRIDKMVWSDGFDTEVRMEEV